MDGTGSGVISNPFTNTFAVSNWQIYNNIFRNNAGGGGIVTRADPNVREMSDIKVYNNTCINSSCEMDFRFATGTGNEFKNNLMHGSTYGFVGGYKGNTWTFSYNYHDSTSSNSGGISESNSQTETITAANLFVAPSSYDYRLKYSFKHGHK